MRDSVFPGVDIRIIEAAAMPDDADRAIRETLAVCFPHKADMYRRRRSIHEMPAWTVCAFDAAGAAAALASVIDRTVHITSPNYPGGDPSSPAAGRDIRVAGVGTVSALPQYRRTGLIDRVMAAILAEALSRGYDAGMLFCKPPLVPVYRRMGWQVHESPVLVRGDDGAPMIKNPSGMHFAMTCPLGTGIPDLPVDALGPAW